VHIDQDDFFVEVILLHNRKLRGQPVIVGGGSDRDVVASCSYGARQFGVHSAMPVRLALQRCPHAVVVKGDMDLFARHSAHVTEIITEAAPVAGKASIDEHHVDITGLEKYQGYAGGPRADLIDHPPNRPADILRPVIDQSCFKDCNPDR
jgi:DNA polymerase-4